MSAKTPRQQKRPGSVTRRRPKLVIAVPLVLSLIAAFTMLANSGAFDHSLRQKGKKRHTVSPASLNSNSPSKEYVYAGGRLVATEEPESSGCTPIAAPNLTTTISNAQMTLTWTIPPGAAKFDVQRSESITFDQSITLASDLPASPLPATTMTLADNGVTFVTLNSDASNSSSIKTYVYRVVAFDQNRACSQSSNLNLGTNIGFGEPINGPPGPQTVVKAYHLAELRVAVNSVWKAANQFPQPISWTNPASVNPQFILNNPVLGDNIDQLRAKLNQALNAIDPALAASYTDPSPIPTPPSGTLSIKAIHFNQLRQRVKGLIPS